MKKSLILKLLSLTLVAVMLLAMLASCKKNPEPQPDTDTETETELTTESETQTETETETEPVTESDTEPETESEPESDPESETEAAAPTLTVAGADISEYVILGDNVDFNARYTDIKIAVRAFCGAELEIVENPETNKVIRLVSDRTFLPNEVALRVNGEALELVVFDTTYVYTALGKACDILEEILAEGESVELAADYCNKVVVDTYIKSYTGVGSTDAKIIVAGTTEKDALSYKKGENIKFKLGVFSGTTVVSVPRIQYTIENSITGEKKTETVDGSLGVITIDAGAYDAAGVVTVTVNILDRYDKKISLATFKTIGDAGTCHFRGTAVVNMEEITARTEIPEDFDEFWTSAKEALYATDLTVNRMVEMPSTQDGFRLFAVNVQCNIGDKEGIATGYLTYPSNASADNKVGIIVRFEGYAAAGAPAIVYQEGMAVLSATALEIDLEKLEDGDYMAGIVDERLGVFEDPAESPFYAMVLRDLQLSRFMMAEFGPQGKNWWNGTEFITAGGSQGGFQAYAVAALDSNVTKCCPDIPWLCDVDAGNGNTGIKSTFWPFYSASLKYISGTSFAHLIKCEVVINAGLGDSVCPVETVIAFYNSLTCKKTAVLTQNSGHGGTIENVVYTVSAPAAPAAPAQPAE